LKRLLESAEIQATREANLDRMIVEGYLPGREVAVEGLLTEGRLRVLAIFDKPDPLEGPYFEETIYVTPSRFSPSQQREIDKCAEGAVRALGLSHGPIHAEFRINDEGVWPLEVAPRPIGGLCARSLRFAPDSSTESISLEELLIRHALQLPFSDWPREKSASGVMMIPVPKSGILEKVEGVDEALSVRGITSLEITARRHDYVAAWPEGSSYLGFLFAKGNSPEEVESAIRAAQAKLRFQLAPRLPVEHPVTHRMPAAGG
jgi:formate-dependent phosphoribosylglycinamide formyltransferase (GAR transformylase)